MKQHQANALAVATFLETSPHVSQVYYPGLPSHPQNALSVSQTLGNGHGGMVTFRLSSSSPNVTLSNAFLSSLRIFALAESLGGVESLAELPSVMTHASLTPEARMELGVDDGLIRLSCGVEEAKDLIADLEQALEKAFRKAV